MTTYIDSDYVLRSSSPVFNTRNVLLTNSQRTKSTAELSFNRSREFSPHRHSTAELRRSTSPSSEVARILRRSMSPSEMKRSLRDQLGATSPRVSQRSASPERFTIENNRLLRSLRNTSPKRRSMEREPSATVHISRSRERNVSDASYKEHAYRPVNELATWSTHPIHLKRESSSRSKSGHRSRSASPYRRRSRSPSPRILSSSSTRSRLYEGYDQTADRLLASDYFPITMKAKQINHIDPPMSRSMAKSPPPKHLRSEPQHKWRADGKIQGPDEQEILDILDKELEISKMYNMSDCAPATAVGSTVHMVSPYAQDLASLRLDRLKIEEDHLLQMKRLNEVERLRGPKQKWYELKTPDFHYEARKNKEMLANQKHWDGLLDYRKSSKSSSPRIQYNATEYI